MNEIKFAVVCVGYEDSHVYSVDLFSDYKAAQEFMRKDAKETNEECMNGLMLEDYGDEIVAFVDDEPCYCCVIVATNIH